MSHIHIKFCQIDAISGAIFVQFATDEQLHMIDQQTMHGFFPAEHGTDDIEKLMPEIAKFGQQMLSQEAEVQQNQLNQTQVANFQPLIGTVRSMPIDTPSADAGDISGSVSGGNQYSIDSTANINGNVDQMRNIVLEILAEEGLIPGEVK